MQIQTVFADLRGQWFLAYEHSQIAGQFNLKRGYLTIQHQFTDKFSGRIIHDLSVDRKGDGKEMWNYA